MQSPLHPKTDFAGCSPSALRQNSESGPKTTLIASDLPYIRLHWFVTFIYVRIWQSSGKSLSIRQSAIELARRH